MTPADWDESKKDFTDKWKMTVEDAATVGQTYLVSPWLDESLRKDMTSFKNYMGVFNKCGELCKKHGLKFGYHNHDFELSTKLDGELLYDLILKNTDPSSGGATNRHWKYVWKRRQGIGHHEKIPRSF